MQYRRLYFGNKQQNACFVMKLWKTDGPEKLIYPSSSNSTIMRGFENDFADHKSYSCDFGARQAQP